ncbi:MAG TPA: AbrB/MazE/SpoVT family DNA-binding domain-containing protein [Geminicoccaceae bacterium]|nr:AbrB/MazE/SpoVT family DNA-binding domain-containing protein [Geminicoccaceae bacterium]
MKVQLVRIGNSRGVRIPKAIIEQCGFAGTVEMTVEGSRLVLAPVENPREGWEEAFAAAAAAGEMPPEPENDFPNEWDEREWTW